MLSNIVKFHSIIENVKFMLNLITNIGEHLLFLGKQDNSFIWSVLPTVIGFKQNYLFLMNI